MPGGDTHDDVPAPGDWPCQQPCATDSELPPRLVPFLYRLLRDGVSAPGDVEAHAIQAGLSSARGTTSYTNAHLERYARSLATYLSR